MYEQGRLDAYLKSVSTYLLGLDNCHLLDKLSIAVMCAPKPALLNQGEKI